MFLYKNRIKISEIDLKEKVVSIKRVTKVVKGGRNFSFSAIIIVGNKKGIVGYGLGKANEVTSAITKGSKDAKKKLIKVPIIKDTIPHKSIGKFGGSLIMLRPASKGTGIIAGGGVRLVLEIAGVNNVLAKSQKSSNPHNIIKATFNALIQLRDPFTVSKQRNISLNKLFNG
jgi:small subunit ribosomal protein S5